MGYTEIECAARCLIASALAETKRSFGRIPVSTQRSMFMLPAGPSSASGQERRRRISGRLKIKEHLQTWLWSNPEEYRKLVSVLGNYDVRPETVAHGYVLPLLYQWADSPRPMRISRAQMTQIMVPFVRSVVDKVATTVSVDVVFGSFLNTVVERRIGLESRVVLRPISEDELWQFGDIDQYFVGAWREELHSYWAVLEIRISHPVEDEPVELPDLKRAFISAMVLSYPAYFRVEPVVISQDYGPPGRRGGKAGNEAWQIRGAFNRGHQPRTMNAEEEAGLAERWSLTSTVANDAKNYLRLPMERLVDSVGRERPDDGLIDAVIGLEALYSPNSTSEAALRFALTGAHLLGNDSQSRGEWYERLRRIYQFRSGLVHGRSIRDQNFHDLRMSAEEALRRSWLEFATNSLENGNAVMNKIKDSWLSAT